MGDTLTNHARKKYIDAVKGFCIILVLFSHAAGIPYIGGILFACYMQVYFIVGGITYTDRRDEKASCFISKKAKRLLVPYAIYGTVLWLIDCIVEQLTIPEIVRGGAGIIYARHCLYLYHGHENNLFLLDNLNGQLWFLPAIFISYILFWIIVRSDKKLRPFIIVAYIAINIATSFLPILLPWSLDTVFITAVLMYLGFLIKSFLVYIEQLNIKKVFKLKVFISIIFTVMLYLFSVKLCGGINTSVRIFGSHGVISVFLYMMVGILGTVLYMIGFAVAENTSWLNAICETFAYIGRNTLVVLATHVAVFNLVDSALNRFQLDMGYIGTLIKVAAATVIGLAFSVIIKKFGSKNAALLI